MKSAHSSGGVIHANLSESEFLRIEAGKAKSNMARSLKQAKDSLAQGVDPRVPMRKHPIIAISLAAFAGFAGTLVAVPSKRERELRHLERLHRATNPSPEKPSESEAVKTAVDGAYQAAKPAIWVMLLKEIVAFAKPILLAQITNKIRQQSQQPVPPPPTQPSF